MAVAHAANGSFSLKAYRGDTKTLLAFNLDGELARTDLAGFTIQVRPPGGEPYFIQNFLRFEKPGDHAQDPQEPAFSSVNAPIHKFRWLHIPGTVHQGINPKLGMYRYTVTPRYFEAGSLQPLDPAKSASVDVEVNRFAKGKLSLGFTRGYTQSQAFVRHFGLKAVIRPRDAGLIFDTSEVSGTNAQGESYTFAQQYEWLGFSARERIFDLLEEVRRNTELKLDVFAYDLNEPDLVKVLLELGKSKQARVILDNAALHHSKTDPKPEDEFEELFAQQAGRNPVRIQRRKFGRYAHDKVFIISDGNGPRTVLTGSTNFSVTGLYVNSNHVLVFDDREVARAYADVFEQTWTSKDSAAVFAGSAAAKKRYEFEEGLPPTTITFSPHEEEFATELLGGLVARVHQEGQATVSPGNVLFAVMQLDGGKENPVYDALNELHASQSIFSYGISDSPKGISLYPVGTKTGVLVTGKPIDTQLPPPFSQVPGVGLGHQVHHKFVVCGFRGSDPIVYCGSSNLALMGEQVNGDNLLVIRDPDVATVFAIEALALVDHFDFLDRTAAGPKAKGKKPAAVKQQAAVSAGWFLSTSDGWAHKYFDSADLHCVDRELFGG